MGNFLKKITEHFKLKKERWELMKRLAEENTLYHIPPEMLFDESEIIVEDNIDLEIPFK